MDFKWLLLHKKTEVRRLVLFCFFLYQHPFLGIGCDQVMHRIGFMPILRRQAGRFGRLFRFLAGSILIIIKSIGFSGVDTDKPKLLRPSSREVMNPLL